MTYHKWNAEIDISKGMLFICKLIISLKCYKTMGFVMRFLNNMETSNIYLCRLCYQVFNTWEQRNQHEITYHNIDSQVIT